jgi:hypothetical protein
MELDKYYQHTLGTKDTTLNKINCMLYDCMTSDEFVHSETDEELPWGYHHLYNYPRIKELRLCTKDEFAAIANTKQRQFPINCFPAFKYRYVAVLRIKHSSKMPEYVGEDTVFALGFGMTPKATVENAISILMNSLGAVPNLSKKRQEDERGFLDKLKRVLIDGEPLESRKLFFPNEWK